MMGFFMYYRSENIRAFNDFSESLSELNRAAKAFADEFEAWPIVLSNDAGYRFDSIEFKDPIAGVIAAWTPPDRLTRGQVPRRQPVHPQDACYHAAVVTKWETARNTHFKRGTVVSKLPLQRALGSVRIVLIFKMGDYVYFEAGGEVRAKMITLQEFERAKNEAELQSDTRGRPIPMR